MDRVGDRDEVEDVVQDAMVTAIVHILTMPTTDSDKPIADSEASRLPWRNGYPWSTRTMSSVWRSRPCFSAFQSASSADRVSALVAAGRHPAQWSLSAGSVPFRRDELFPRTRLADEASRPASEAVLTSYLLP